MNYLVFDLGTGNSRVGLVSSDNHIYGVKTFTNIYNEDKLYLDAQSFSPDVWKRELIKIAKELIAENPGVVINGITSSGARQTIVVVDKDNKEIYGLPNIDNRGREWVKDIKDGAKIYQLSGKWLTEDFPAAKLLGLKKKRENIYQNAKSFTSLSEWFALMFTGELCIEPSQACETQLFDIEKREWSEFLINSFDLNELTMPKIVRGGTNLGHITESGKALLGVNYDIDFVVGGADTQVAILGANIQEGDIGIISGTTSPVVYLTKKKIDDPKEGCWVDCFIKDDTYMIETNPGVSGLNYQRLKTLMLSDLSYETIEKQLSEVKENRMVAMLSSLDFENARGNKLGGFIMKPPFNGEITRIDFAWAVLADIACAIMYQQNNLQKLISNCSDYILGCGGGFQSPTLSQHIADLSGKEFRLPKGFSQSSILGCVKLLNGTFGVKCDGQLSEFITYQPRENQLIHEYYDKWLETREVVNK